VLLLSCAREAPRRLLGILIGSRAAPHFQAVFSLHRSASTRRRVSGTSNRFPTMTKPMRSSPLAILRASGRSRPVASPFAICLTDCKGTPCEGGFRTLGHDNAMTADTVGLIMSMTSSPSASATRDADVAGDHMMCPAQPNWMSVAITAKMIVP
jgi:hypothetical protein